MPVKNIVLMQSDEGRRLVQEKCAAAGLDIEVLSRLIETELKQKGKQRKHLRDDFDAIFDNRNGAM